MANIEKRHIIERNLSEEAYFASLLQEAYACGLLCESDIENIQMQCLNLLAYKCERFNSGDSSSVRVEVAESIMKSNIFTISLYLKSLPDAEQAVDELLNVPIADLYQKGRKIIDIKFHAAEHVYKLVQKNRIITKNHSYNDTLSDDGIGLFFTSYRPDFTAHETPASIDYQLCNPVGDLEGVEFILKYLTHLNIENEFCSYFEPAKVHYLLNGYDVKYKHLLINVFEQVLIGSIGCALAERSIVELYLSEEDVGEIYINLLKETGVSLDQIIQKTSVKVIEELKITSAPVLNYIEKSLPKISSDIRSAVSTSSLDKVFVAPVNADQPKIEFISTVKMNDEDYWKLINKLSTCRYSADKIAIIKEKVKSFSDIEGILFDAVLEEKEILSIFRILGDIELAALIKRHPFKNYNRSEISSEDYALRLLLKYFYNKMPMKRQECIDQIIEQLVFSK